MENEKYPLINYLPFKLSLYIIFKINEEYEISKDILSKLLSNYEDIKAILKLKNLNIIKYLYFNKNDIYKILYNENNTINIENDIKNNTLCYNFYISLLIKDNPEYINYSNSFEYITILNNEKNKIKDKLKKIFISKIIIELIYNNFRNNKIDKEREEKLKLIEIENKDIIKSNINLGIFKEINLNLNENDIETKKIDELYIEIINELIKNKKFEDYEYTYNIINQFELENINITKIIFDGLNKILNIENTYIKEIMILNIRDLFDEKKIKFYFILIKYILKNQIHINNILLLVKTKENIKKIINREIEKKNSFIIRSNIWERVQYIIKKIMDTEFYFNKFVKYFKIKSLNEKYNKYKDFSYESLRNEINNKTSNVNNPYIYNIKNDLNKFFYIWKKFEISIKKNELNNLDINDKLALIEYFENENNNNILLEIYNTDKNECFLKSNIVYDNKTKYMNSTNLVNNLNSNIKENIPNYSSIEDFFNGKTILLKKENIREITELYDFDEESNVDYTSKTSISNILKEENLKYEFKDIYCEMIQIMENSIFKLILYEQNIIIKIICKDDYIIDYVILIEQYNKFKNEIFINQKYKNTFENLEKFIKFIEKIKNKIKKEIKNEFNIEMKLKFQSEYNNDDNSNENIIFEKLFENKNVIENEIFKDIDILNNGILDNFNSFLKKIKEFKQSFIRLSPIPKKYISENDSMNSSFEEFEEIINLLNNEEIHIINNDSTLNLLKSIENIDIKKDLELNEISEEDENENIEDQLNKGQFISFNEKDNILDLSIILKNIEEENSRINNKLKNILKKSTIFLYINKNNNQNYSINYKEIIYENESLSYEEFIKTIDKQKKNIFNENDYFILEQFDKLLKFLENIKEIVKDKYTNENNLEIKLNLEEIEDEDNFLFKNISCTYILDSPLAISIDMKDYKDKDIFDNQKNFIQFIEEINKKDNNTIKKNNNRFLIL